MPTLKTITLGCKVNQYETEYVRQGFERLGYRTATHGEPVDLCIVNSCTVTAESEAKSRKIIRRLAKKHPAAEIIVMGCYAARNADEAASLPGVVEVIADKRDLPNWLRRRGLVDVPTGISRFDRRRRAYVKIQDGCQNRCTYCIVPTVRPHLVSRPIDDILDEIHRLLDHGHHEIILTGIHLGAYGMGDVGQGMWEGEPTFPVPPSSSLAPLLGRIAKLDGDFRVRLSSIEAIEVTPELLDTMAEYPAKICPQLHLPLQSGSNAVLRRMNRRESLEQFTERCRNIRTILERPALTTDIIVGFPGETEDDFAATCRAVEEIGFAKVHVFRFSPREGTPAATMPNQVTNRVVQHRATQLTALSNAVCENYLRTLLGRPLRVLVEMPLIGRSGWIEGTCDRYTTVTLPSDRNLIGQFTSVIADHVENGRLVCSAQPLRESSAQSSDAVFK
jgi:threonylcarbamoyladenosine tRNA methylthiotransferase MtaB